MNSVLFFIYATILKIVLLLHKIHKMNGIDEVVVFHFWKCSMDLDEIL